MKKIIIIDDSTSFLKKLKSEIEEKFGFVDLKVFNNPLDAIKEINKDFDLIIIDWEMEFIDGKKFLDYAESLGIPFYKIVIISAKEAPELHKHFKRGSVLSVINKSDPLQMNALFMIIENIGCT